MAHYYAKFQVSIAQVVSLSCIVFTLATVNLLLTSTWPKGPAVHGDIVVYIVKRRKIHRATNTEV